MTLNLNVTIAELRAQASTINHFIEHELGFDSSHRTEFQIEHNQICCYLSGTDEFQKGAQYSLQNNQLGAFIYGEPDGDWDAFLAEIWETLQHHPRRDERELRFACAQSSRLLEQAKTFESHVGQLFASRVRAARDDARANLLTYEHKRAHVASGADPLPTSGYEEPLS